MKKQRLIEIIKEEIDNVKWGNTLNEDFGSEDEKVVRDLIRKEIAAIFFDLFKKRKSWGA